MRWLVLCLLTVFTACGRTSGGGGGGTTETLTGLYRDDPLGDTTVLDVAQAQLAASGFDFHGWAAASSFGTKSQEGDAGDGRFVQITSGASSGDDMRWHFSGGRTPTNTVLFSARIKTDLDDATNVLNWVMLTDVLASDCDLDEPIGDVAGFRFLAGTDANWMVATRDGSTMTLTDSSVAYSTATVYEFQIDFTDYGSGELDFYINGSLVDTATANLPTASVKLAACLGGETKTTAAREMFIGHVLRRGF